LIATADPKSGARFTVGETLDVAQHNDLTLTWRQVIEGRIEDRRQGACIEPIFTLL
jgi:hypothetical protein